MKKYILDEKIWETPYVDDTGFVFEAQVLLYKPYIEEIQKRSIHNLNLGEFKKIPCDVKAEEWGNTFHFIAKGFDIKAPVDRKDALLSLILRSRCFKC